MLDLNQDLTLIRSEIESYCVKTVDTANEALSGFTPTEIIILTIATLVSSLYVIDTLRVWWKIGPYVLVFRFFAATFFKAKTQAEGDKAYKTYYEKYLEARKNFKVTEIPEKAMTEDQIMTRLKAAEVINRKCYKDGAHMSGGIYIADDSHWEFVAKA
jgi:hypothetical protein